MLKVDIYYNREQLDSIEVEENTSVRKILTNYKANIAYPIYAC